MMKKIQCCQNDKVSKKDFDDVNNFLDIMSEKNRLHILCLLRNGERCACEIYEPLGIAQNLASHHLKVLKDFGLIEARKSGRKILYSTNKKNITKYTNLLNNFLTKNI